jgi:hypothetical protein
MINTFSDFDAPLAIEPPLEAADATAPRDPKTR